MGEVEKRSKLPMKVVLGFSVALLAVAIAGIINFTSLNRLVTSINIISEPDLKLIYLKQLITKLPQEESSVRSYTLTHDERYLDSYLHFSDTVQNIVSQLQLLTAGDPRQGPLTDSVAHLISQREGVFSQFIDKRKAQLLAQKENPVEVVKKKPQIQKDTIQQVVTAEEAIPDTIATSTTTKESKGLFQKIKNVFSSDKKKDKGRDEVNNETAQIDTSARVKPAEEQEPAVSTTDLEEMLGKQQARLEQVRLWSEDELLLIQQDKMLMDRISVAISLLERDEEMVATRQVVAAKKVASKATRSMAVIGVLGILSSLLFVYLILRDIRRSNRLKLQLIEERARAEKLAKVKEEFLANMSHEIRTPLNAIVGFTEQLSKQEGNDKQRRFIGAIQHSSDHLTSLVNQILDFSKLEAGKLKRDKSTFDFHGLIYEVYETFRIKASEKNILLSYHIDKGIPRFVYGDPVTLKQILINLVSNAVKFTEQGSVEIHCDITESASENLKIKLEVTDSGIGIPIEMRDKIFEEFTQGQNEISRKYGGTGLGLTITKKLTESIKGSIHVTSKPGEGSAFTVIIPLRKSVTPENYEQKQEAPLNGSILRNKTVLLVDDEEMNVMLGQTILESWGIRVDIARNGKEAIEKLQVNEYSLVLMDIQMPEISGLEVLEWIRVSEGDDEKRTPVIALTANVFSEQLKNNTKADFDDVLVKPFKEKELFDKMTKLMMPLENGSVKEADYSDQAKEIDDDDELFSLKYLEKTSGANRDFEIRMLKSFVQNNAVHIIRLKEALASHDWDAIYSLVHKMIPQFRYLQIRKTEDKLKSIELLTEQKKHLEQVPVLVNGVVLATEEVLVSIRQEIKRLEEESQPAQAPHETVHQPHL